MKHLQKLTRTPGKAQLDLGEIVSMLAKILQAVGMMMTTKEESTQGPYDW
jgi:hypothetical protein